MVYLRNDAVSSDLLTIREYEAKGNLPNPFLFENGKVVCSTADWKKRREEIYETAVELQFGVLPPPPEFVKVEQLNCGKMHRSYKIHAGTQNSLVSFVIKVIMPSGNDRPVIVDGDMCAGYFMEPDFTAAATKQDIGWVLFDRTELAHDLKGEGWRKGALYDIYPDYDFGALAAWAWGYSRCIDALEILKLPQIDLSCIAFTGHSRGGKAALLAGATDYRAVIVNPNEACLGGGSCYRIRMTADYPGLRPWRSETLKDIWEDSAFWLGPKMGQYVDSEESLPFDAHYLKALVAPRVLFVSEAAADVWANPIGSWMTTIAAGEVYKFLNAESKLYWYFRTGTHYHKPEDIEKLVSIILHVHDSEPLCDGFFALPFVPPKKIYSWTIPQIEKK